jgi:hypothetical protein
MTATLEKILAEVETLSSGERTQLRDILAKEPAQADPAKEEARRRALIHELQGRYANLPGSSEEFMAERRADTERENARFSR